MTTVCFDTNKECFDLSTSKEKDNLYLIDVVGSQLSSFILVINLFISFDYQKSLNQLFGTPKPS